MQPDLTKKIKVLHVLGGLNRGGVEAWLAHLMRFIDHEQFDMDFAVHTDKPCAFDEDILSLGGRIIPCLYPAKPMVYAAGLRRILREYGPYDVVHSHVHHFSGLVLHIARQMGVPVRIAHSHNDRSQAEAGSSMIRKAYLLLMKRMISANATCGLAVSRCAAEDLFGGNWKSDPRWQKLLLGIDLTPFYKFPDQKIVRSELGIPENAFAIGHIGSFTEQKNHNFLIEIAYELQKLDRRSVFLLVGDGPLRPMIEEKIKRLRLDKNVILTGLRSDVPRLMMGAMDMFLLPSLFEGFPLVLMEAQAARLRCLISDNIGEEADLVPELVNRFWLAHPASLWAETILKMSKTAPTISRKEALLRIKNSPVNIEASTKRIENLYTTLRKAA